MTGSASICQLNPSRTPLTDHLPLEVVEPAASTQALDADVVEEVVPIMFFG
jgi:hypothetical protein